MTIPASPEQAAESAARYGRGARRKAGRAARDDVPISEQARLAASDRDPVATLERQAESRVTSLIAIRHGRMAASPFAFYRGAAALMAHDLRREPDSGIVTWLCGDAHLSNVGLYASPERELVMDVNDFDETAPGPFEWDLKRMAASFELAARARGFDDDERGDIVAEVVHAYAGAMDGLAGAARLRLATATVSASTLIEATGQALDATAADRVAKVLAKAQRRDSRQAARKLMEVVDGEPRFRSQPPLLTPLREIAEHGDLDEVEAREYLSAVLERYRQSLAPDRRQVLDGYAFVDAAMKVVGVGSVGTRAWVVLLRGNGRRDLLMLQAKEAQRSVLESTTGPSGFAHQGERVVRGQRIMQALSDVLLGWLTAEGLDGVPRDFYMRQFRDWKGSADPSIMEPETMRLYAQYCGVLLARAHARGGDAATIAGYVGRGRSLARALAEFATAYADRTEEDHRALLAAIASGRVEAVDA
ncbi:hypothetical protein ARHIZOSPH14_16300 [Agromyces rhizosphaerae]|uniref:DUF2252 domain-containing protein n=1 Tax=Agromyces rhizosphaerae TaxID=88374 RepID=A0A9W6CRX7_9MICO|nr:DUF2252 domain-containing protein [Agromyces rhizosphaerae]GLI27388.1 hypothetical protein ARHIZOSPH14_16300 [Agromyces rhizosphaerae]